MPRHSYFRSQKIRRVKRRSCIELTLMVFFLALGDPEPPDNERYQRHPDDIDNQNVHESSVSLWIEKPQPVRIAYDRDRRHGHSRAGYHWIE
jgi:hypothetical protein